MEWWATYTLDVKMCPDRGSFFSFVPGPWRDLLGQILRSHAAHNDYITCNTERHFRFPFRLIPDPHTFS